MRSANLRLRPSGQTRPLRTATPISVQRSESDDESLDMAISGGLFDDPVDDLSAPTSYSEDFWIALRAADGDNTMGNIILSVALAWEQLQPPGSNNKGVRYVGATALGVELAASTWSHRPRHLLGRSRSTGCPTRKVRSYAERAWFEYSKCEYFMTTQLSGCRFVITESRVMHVASDVLGAQSEDSKTRDKAELPLVEGARTVRRMSFTARKGYRSKRTRRASPNTTRLPS
jgi:hypothetical protein